MKISYIVIIKFVSTETVTSMKIDITLKITPYMTKAPFLYWPKKHDSYRYVPA